MSAQGSTLRDLIADVDSRHAGFAAQLVEPTGEQRRFVNIYVNDEDVRFLGKLETPVKDGDVVSILPAMAGGSGPSPAAAGEG